MRMKIIGVITLIILIFSSCEDEERVIVPQWSTIELEVKARKSYDNPYMDVDLHAEFTDKLGNSYVRPAFWDGENTWKVRFAPPEEGLVYNWKTVLPDGDDQGLLETGTFISTSPDPTYFYTEKGLLMMSKGHRNVVHRNGDSFLVVGDTPWALPFRATHDQVLEYARDRRQKGFNAALLMTIQPDQKAAGPDARDTELGFARAFLDVPEGHATMLQPEYFQYLDESISILIGHGIVPVYQPIFHGFGWKGLATLGKDIPANEYVRYCKYLLARYGSYPAFWLLAGDNNAQDPGVKETGEMMEKWDCYAQPTGLHYNPCDDFIATWATEVPEMCMHYNKVHQEEPWLDFQWAQTGHDGLHQYHKVERIYENKPTKASSNGEPTYEGMGDGKKGLGWWQGEEAWMQLMSGGTMGVVYGAATLWQWKVTKDEPGWESWTDQDKSWREAMKMEGSTYVGLLGKILQPYDLTDIEKRWDLAGGKPLLAQPGRLYISYLNEGGEIRVNHLPASYDAKWINPKTGDSTLATATNNSFTAPSGEPWVVIIEGK